MKVELNKSVYLGDGVYATYDGYQITLCTERQEPQHTIHIEPAVWAMLVEFKEALKDINS